MPQMMPLSWISLCIYSIMIVMLITLHLYFNVCIFSNVSSFNKLKSNFYFSLMC